MRHPILLRGVDSNVNHNGIREYALNGEIANTYKPAYDKFIEKYDIQGVISDDKDYYSQYILRNERQCAFCGLNSKDTTFKSKAHLIPKSLGNKRLLYYHECDECNNHFSQFETDLANYVGIKNIQYSDRNKQYSHIANKFTIKKTTNGLGLDIKGKKLALIVEEDHLKLPFNTHPYSLLNIWKLLVKMALCAMPIDDLCNYEGLIQTLFKDCNYMHETHYKEIYMAYIHRANGRIKNPIGILFKKKEPNIRALTHTFQFYFYDEVWQIFLPMYKNDDVLYNGETTIQNHYCPPVLFNEEFIEKSDKTPTVEIIYANKKAKTRRSQSVKLPMEAAYRNQEKFILYKKAEQLTKHYQKLSSVKFIKRNVDNS